MAVGWQMVEQTMQKEKVRENNCLLLEIGKKIIFYGLAEYFIFARQILLCNFIFAVAKKDCLLRIFVRKIAKLVFSPI